MSYSNRRIALAAILALALPLVVAAPALADEVATHVSSLRGSSLPVVAPADQIAGGSAAAQAAARDIFHTNISGLLGTCESAGEVVGAGPDVPSIFAAFQQSSSHRNIINNPAWTAMGTGLATAGDGTVFVSVVFCRLAAAPPAETASEPPAAGKTADPPPSETSDSVIAPREIAPPAPVLEEVLPAIGARRSAIRARLDRQARSMLPDWYVGVCGTGDRDRVFGGRTFDSGACPKAA